MATFLKKIWVYFLRIISTVFRTLAHWFLALVFLGRKQVVPPITDPILLKSAISLAADIREGKIKSEDVIKSYCARIKEVNPYINAICDERFEDALKEAREVDTFVASRKKTLEQLQEETPLLGIPITVKLIVGLKGLPSNNGCFLHKDDVLYEDPVVVTLMKNAGAICLATTNTPEFGINFETYNTIYGRTCNPYNTTRSAGGSSGGEGALIGSAGSLMGIGNDLAGSIRHPGNFNGIFGHKPTAGMVSNDGIPMVVPPHISQMLTAGPMCRYAEDMVLAMKILSNVKETHVDLNKSVDFSTLKIYYILEDGNPLSSRVSSEIKDAIRTAMDHFRTTYGTVVKEINLKELSHAFLMYFHILLGPIGWDFKEILTQGKCNLNSKTELLKFIFGQSKLTLGPLMGLYSKYIPMIHSKKNYPEMQNRLKKLQQELDVYLDDNSVLFLPSFPTTAHYHYGLMPLFPGISFMCIFNMLGNPVTQCPVGLSENHLPLGFQVAAAQGQDALSLACAVEIEKAFGGWVPPQPHLSTVTSQETTHL